MTHADLAEPAVLKAFLARHGLSAEKGLGQHFLISKPAVEAIVRALAGCNGLMEIGPGPGVLTAPLSNLCDKMIALELDPRMIEALKESAPKALVLQKDALRADVPSLLRDLPEPRGIVSNLPYYITGSLLQLVAEQAPLIDRAVLTMQKEVAARVVAKERTPARGSLSVYLQSIFEISHVARVPAGSFLPPPKVDSTVLLFKPKLGQRPEDLYFRLVKLGFAQPRKTLINNLVAGFHLQREKAVEVVGRAGLSEKSRPQELSLAEWEYLTEAVKAAL